MSQIIRHSGCFRHIRRAVQQAVVHGFHAVTAVGYAPLSKVSRNAGTIISGLIIEAKRTVEAQLKPSYNICIQKNNDCVMGYP